MIVVGLVDSTRLEAVDGDFKQKDAIYRLEMVESKRRKRRFARLSGNGLAYGSMMG
jgi:hypothetical protein